MASLAEIRSRLAASENRGQSNNTQMDNTLYPFWNIDEGKSATIRFLPDGNPNNTFFWVERAMIRLEFAGIKGGEEKKSVTVRVPCVEMWGDTCPILTEVRAWFKDKSLEELGRKYWKKRDYLFQGIVRENPIAEENAPENPVRRLIIGPQIFNIVKSALMDPELDELPTDYQRGLDFRVTKGSKGGYADYSTSTWSRRESALSDSELAAIKNHGLFDLSTFLPKKPNEVELKVMFEMFEASVDGQAYDPERWSQYFKPAGVMLPQTSDTSTSVESKPTPVSVPKAKVVETVEEDDDDTVSPPVNVTSTQKDTAEVSSSSSKAEDILALIRARQTQA